MSHHVATRLTHEAVQAWLDAYERAWETYDPEAIAALWTDDAEYRWHPADEPTVGRDAIVRDWLHPGGNASDRDAPNIGRMPSMGTGPSRSARAPTGPMRRDPRSTGSTTTTGCSSSDRTAAAARSPSTGCRPGAPEQRGRGCVAPAASLTPGLRSAEPPHVASVQRGLA
jgi:hypothetical protein